MPDEKAVEEMGRKVRNHFASRLIQHPTPLEISEFVLSEIKKAEGEAYERAAKVAENHHTGNQYAIASSILTLAGKEKG